MPSWSKPSIKSRHGMPCRAAQSARVIGRRIGKCKFGAAGAIRLFWSEHHHDLTPFEARLGFNLGDLGRIGLDLLKKLKTDFLVGHFAAAEAQGDFDFVTFLEEPLDGLHLHPIVMSVDVRPDFYFLDFNGFLLFARLVGLFLRLVFEFAIVEDLANGRLGARRYLDQVEACLLGQRQGLGRAHDADLFTFFIDQKYFAGIYPIVHTRPIITGTLFFDKWFAVYVQFSFVRQQVRRAPQSANFIDACLYIVKFRMKSSVEAYCARHERFCRASAAFRPRHGESGRREAWPARWNLPKSEVALHWPTAMRMPALPQPACCGSAASIRTWPAPRRRRWRQRHERRAGRV